MTEERDILRLKGAVEPRTFNLLYRRQFTLDELCIMKDGELLGLGQIGEQTRNDIRTGMGLIRHCTLCIREANQVEPVKEQIASCIFSEDRRYRYNWTRRISDKPGRCLFIALNPAKADEYRSDNTVTRGCRIVDAWDIGIFEMGNLCAYRATNPADMKAAADPVGPENDRYLREAIRRNPLIVVCWGVHGDFMDRDREVLRLIEYEGKRPMCLGTTLAGFPRHPSRLGYGVPPSIYYGRKR